MRIFSKKIGTSEQFFFVKKNQLEISVNLMQTPTSEANQTPTSEAGALPQGRCRGRGLSPIFFYPNG